jgi:hypothetical protein
MKTIAAIALTALPLAAHAYDLNPSAVCPTYCTGITTSDPAYTVDWLNLRNYANNTTHISINGVQYTGIAAWQRTNVVGAGTRTVNTDWYEDIPMRSADGTLEIRFQGAYHSLARLGTRSWSEVDTFSWGTVTPL